MWKSLSSADSGDRNSLNSQSHADIAPRIGTDYRVCPVLELRDDNMSIAKTPGRDSTFDKL